MKPTYKELQKKIVELEHALANCLKEQIRGGSPENLNRVFEAVISQSPSAIFITNELGIIGYANDAFYQILGYSPEEMKEELMLSILKGDESLLKYEELKEAIQKGEIWRGELRTARKDNQVIWISLVIFPLMHQRKITNYVAIFNDINELKVIEAKKKKQELVYWTLIENLPLAIAIFDKNGKILYANEITENFLRLEKGSTIGKTCHQLYPKETADDMVNLIRRVIKTGQPINVDRNLNLFGQQRHLKVTRQPLFDEHGKVTRVLAIGEDITAQTRQLQLLDIQHRIDSLSNLSANLQSSLKLAFQSLMRIDWVDGGGIYLFDEDRKHLRLVFSTGLSKEYIRMVSVYSADEIPTQLILNGISEYIDVRELDEPFKNILVKEGLTFAVIIPLIYEKEVIGSLNLGSKSVDQVNQPDRMIIESIAKRLANLVVLVKTQVQLDRSNNELNTKLQELNIKHQMLIQKSRLESLGEMSAGLAHEINQPLSVISLVMENIQYKFAQKTASENYLDSKFITITHNINKIRELIDHVRLFSRDQGTIMFERVDVNQVINNAFSMIKSQLRSQQIKVTPDLAEDIGYTVGNPSRFEQVILNLLSNARDALEEKEKKTMHGSLSKEIRITTSNVNEHIIIRVWDNGTGIPIKNLDKIFNPFFTTKIEGHGTGLGLPIVYGIIREMKGEITVRSDEGVFTEIIITLPYHKKC